MLSESGVPRYFWNEAALFARYIINRCPTKAFIKDLIPAELWYRVNINLQKIRTFGIQSLFLGA